MGARSFGSSRTSSSIGGGASASGGGGEKASLEGVASSSDESASPRARALRLRPAALFLLAADAAAPLPPPREAGVAAFLAPPELPERALGAAA